MKEYPSIQGSTKAPKKPMIAFNKLDGSNIRFEWNRKRGWDKVGSRNWRIDETHEHLGESIPLFHQTYAEDISRIIHESKHFKGAQRVTAFIEFFGPSSFAGIHKPNEPKEVVLIDVHIEKKGMIGPRKFLNIFGHLKIPEVVYEGNMNASFIEDVRNGKYDVVEGVVCKGIAPWTLWMAKIKTLAYKDKLKEVFENKWEDFWE